MTPETERLFRFLDLESRVLTAASVTEVAFVVVNETHALVPYRQAMLWSPDAKVEAVSGLATPDPNAPFVLWLNRVFPKLAALHATPAEVDSSAFPEWAEWLPAHGFYVPLGAAGWLLTRDEAWSPPEQVLLGRLAEAVAAARRGFVTKPLFRLPGIKGLRNHLKIVAAVFLVLIFPVTGSVLAPAEMVAARPSVVRAPLDGAIAVIHVQPNDPVAQGQPLFDLDQTTLVGKRDIARQQYATAEAEYRQAAQAQVFDPKAKAQVAILESRMNEKASEALWLDSQLERIHVKAPAAGIAVFDDASDWIGRPVTVGEKVMAVAAETDTEVEAWLPVADAGEARIGAKLTLFLNTRPLSPVHAALRSLAYEATARPDGGLAYRVRAALADPADKPRLGMKGTARIDGDTVPLVWWLFRRPLIAVRQTIGF